MHELSQLLRNQLDRTLESSDLPGLGEKYEGKVRDCYVHDGKRYIVVSDRISAFDVVLGTLPFKGQVLNQIAEYWFRESSEVAPNHMISVPDPNVMIARECQPLRAEFVMRAYLTGVTSTSIWKAYEGGARSFCGHSLPEGLHKNEALPQAILTPSTKAEKGGHDISVSADELLAMGQVSSEHFEEAADMAKRMFAFGQERAKERGLILADTKYEIGVDKETGRMMFIDEIHTPDSSRYWYGEDFEERLAKGEEPRSLDKEFLRRWMSETHGYRGDGPPPPIDPEIAVEASLRYIQMYEQMTGRSFEPDTSENPNARIKKNLGVRS